MYIDRMVARVVSGERYFAVSQYKLPPPKKLYASYVFHETTSRVFDESPGDELRTTKGMYPTFPCSCPWMNSFA
jgi:hypothetical protein